MWLSRRSEGKGAEQMLPKQTDSLPRGALRIHLGCSLLPAMVPETGVLVRQGPMMPHATFSRARSSGQKSFAIQHPQVTHLLHKYFWVPMRCQTLRIGSQTRQTGSLCSQGADTLLGDGEGVDQNLLSSDRDVPRTPPSPPQPQPRLERSGWLPGGGKHKLRYEE